MKKKLFETTKEAITSVLPITLIVLALSFFVSPIPVGPLTMFLFGAILLVLGMAIFTMGADMSLVTMGGDIGISMTKTKNIILVVLISFAMGVIVTIAEPDLQVLANLVPGIPNMLLVLTVAGGVGIFLVLAIIRIIFKISLARMLIVCYLFIIILSMFAPINFVPVAFDSGGVTTGPITVPFILSLGVGLASIRSDKQSQEDSFGLVALSSVGPILAVLLLGIFFRPDATDYVSPIIPEVITSMDVTMEFLKATPHHFIEVAKALWPILAVLVVFQLLTRRYHRRQFLRVLVGSGYTFLGLVLFLTGVDVGFIPVGQLIGSTLANNESMRWLLVPLGALIGYFIVAAEPAVHVLKKQVEEVSEGAIAGEAVQNYLSVGVSVSLALSMIRILTGISIYWFLIPGYALAIILTFFTPKIFIGIAFDSGGVVSGPMTSTFLLPFAIGACVNPELIMTDAFGLVAMVAMTPLIAIQLMGVAYKKKMLAIKQKESDDIDEEDIVEFT